MKRELTAENDTVIKEPTVTKTDERQFEQFANSMIDLMSKLYENQTLKQLNKGTIEKFEDGYLDSQIGNYATVFLSMAKKATKKLLDRFNDDRIESETRKIFMRIDKRSRDKLYSQFEKASGISSKELAATEGLKAATNAQILSTVEWMKRLRDETLELYTASSLRAMTLGNGIDEVLEQYSGLVEKRKNHAAFTAFNQTQNFNALMTKIRVENLGVKKAIWRTSKDEAVRPSHKARDGKEFDLSKGLYSSTDGKDLIPGTDYRCRCRAEYILPSSDKKDA